MKARPKWRLVAGYVHNRAAMAPVETLTGPPARKKPGIKARPDSLNFPVAFAVSERMKDLLTEQAEAEGLARSEFIRMLVEEGLDRRGLATDV